MVAYDDVGGWVAARLWWMLDDLGHRGGVAVLDGGIAGLDRRRRRADDRGRRPGRPAQLHLADAWTGVIDARGADGAARRRSSCSTRGRAALPRRDRADRPGRRPHPDGRQRPGRRQPRTDGRFRPPAELRARFRSLGADGSAGPVVTSCGSGVSACHHALAMRLAGLPDPILYVGSYSDWSRSGEPVATGADPGEPPA